MRVRHMRRFSERLSLFQGRVGVTKVQEAVTDGGPIGLDVQVVS